MGLIDETLAIAEKEINLEMRFKVPFFTGSLISPFIRIMPFLLVYWGFFSLSQEAQLGEFVTPETFVPFLFLGIIADSFFYTGYSTFSGKFLTEKYWQTMEIILLAPINRLSMLTGVGVGEFVAMLPSLVLFLAATYTLYPVATFSLFMVLIVLLMIFMVSLSIGLIVGSANLFNENFGPLFGYLRVAIVFFSCFYYPIEVLKVEAFGAFGGILPVIASFNPIYQGNFIIRQIWFNNLIPFNSVVYLLFFAVISPIAAVYAFRKLWQLLGIQGY